MSRRLLVAAGALALMGLASPAAADVVSPSGACAGSASWKTGGANVTAAGLAPDDVTEVPRSDTVSWSGSVVGPARGTSRQVSGQVGLRLPPPLPAIAIADWSGPSTDVKRSGTYGYDLPSIVPAGVRLDLVVGHDEAGRRHCTATAGLIIAGGPFDSPLIWVALVGLLAAAVGLALLGRSEGRSGGRSRGRSGGRPGAGRIVAGGLVGVPFGLFVAATLVLFGVLALASPVVTALLAAGPAIGALWTLWSPLGSGAPAQPAMDRR